jgi:hypothetical protein
LIRASSLDTASSVYIHGKAMAHRYPSSIFLAKSSSQGIH